MGVMRNDIEQVKQQIEEIRKEMHQDREQKHVKFQDMEQMCAHELEKEITMMQQWVSEKMKTVGGCIDHIQTEEEKLFTWVSEKIISLTQQMEKLEKDVVEDVLLKISVMMKL